MDFSGRREGDEDRFRQSDSASPSSQRFVGGFADQQTRGSPFDPLRGGDPPTDSASGGYGGRGAFDRGMDSSPSPWYARPHESSQLGRGGVGIDYSQALGLEPPLHHPSAFPPRVTAPSTTSGYGMTPTGPDSYYSRHGGHPLRRSPSRDSVNSAGKGV